MRDPTGTPEQRDFALGLALLRAAEVPLRIAEAAADVAELAAARRRPRASPHLRPDATAAAALAEAATRAATHLVEINLATVPGDRHSERADARWRPPRPRRGPAHSERDERAAAPRLEPHRRGGRLDRDPGRVARRVTRDWAIGGATGEGVDVCILDSGVDGDHPLVGGVESAVAVDARRRGDRDRAGRARRRRAGTAPRAPESSARSPRPAGIHSVRVLGEGNTGSAELILGGLRHAIEQRLRGRQPQPLDDEAQVRRAPARARRRRLLQRHGARRLGAQHAGRELSVALLVGDLGRAPRGRTTPCEWYANPNPPVEFFARGVDLDVAWFGGSTLRCTGNSFAAPHIAGLSALVLSKHPGLTPFQLKSVLYLTATNTGGSR